MHGAIRRLSRCTTGLANQMARFHPPFTMSARLVRHAQRRSYWTQGPADSTPLKGYEPPPARDAAEQHARVDAELWEFFRRTRPSAAQLKARATALRRIQLFVTRFVANQGLIVPNGKVTVEPFGSALIGVDQQSSTVDLVVLDPKRPEGYRPGIRYDKVPNALYDVVEFAKWFRKCKQVKPFPKAPVPVVRGIMPDEENPKLRTEFEICVNARNKLYNSRLLAAYVSLDPCVAPLIVILKEWAKKSGLDAAARLRMGPKGRVIVLPRPFSSYTIGQMVVAFMQRLSLLPNLQQPFVTAQPDPEIMARSGAGSTNSPKHLSDDGSTLEVYWSIDVRNPADDKRIPSDIRFLDPYSDPVQQWMAARDERLAREGQQLTLNGLLQGFFRFYAEEFEYARAAISVRDGGIVPRLRRPGYRPPERFFAELSRDLRPRAPPPHLSRVSHNTGNVPLRMRQGDSREIDGLVSRELALLLAAPTDVQPWNDLPLVIVDPIVRSHNVAQAVTDHQLDRFVEECKRAAGVLRLGLGFRDLLTHALPVRRAQLKTRSSKPVKRPSPASRG